MVKVKFHFVMLSVIERTIISGVKVSWNASFVRLSCLEESRLWEWLWICQIDMFGDSTEPLCQYTERLGMETYLHYWNKVH